MASYGQTRKNDTAGTFGHHGQRNSQCAPQQMLPLTVLQEGTELPKGVRRESREYSVGPHIIRHE